MTERLLIIIVLYQIKLEDTLTFKSLAALVEAGSVLNLFVYDNSPLKQFQEKEIHGFNIKYIHDSKNSGISKAYNAGAEYAGQHHKEILLLLDQDSDLPDDFLKVIFEQLSLYPSIQLFAPILKQGTLILSPCKFTYMKGSSLSQIEGGIKSLKNISIFNSGIVIKLNAYYKSGGYNELIKLDFSDHYFIHQFKKHYEQFVVLPVVVEHELSSHTLDEAKILRRFNQYCEGVKAYKSLEGHGLLLFFWTSLRAIKLTIQFRNPEFAMVFMNKFITGNK
ncbi:glycosyltransferase [Pedobacter sp.]|uniref:glycosyltransferase n=1 Tax=Pedobacter sp. TaxID=1411316 RepID=UPI003D7FE205